jgi:carbon-monoxide dehydrogenase large subunit
VGGARISSQDGCTIKLEPSGKLTCMTGVTEQGQGTDAMIAQVARARWRGDGDVRADRDTSRPTAAAPPQRRRTGGEAALQTGKAFPNPQGRRAILREPEDWTFARASGRAHGEVGDLAELGRIAYFRPDTLPKDFQAELAVTRHYVPRHQGFAFTNGVQLSHVEVDTDTGFVRLLKHWVVEDCGRIINPKLVDEQLRGAIVQGIGAAPTSTGSRR